MQIIKAMNKNSNNKMNKPRMKIKQKIMKIKMDKMLNKITIYSNSNNKNKNKKIIKIQKKIIMK